jgi:hypothetical protein
LSFQWATWTLKESASKVQLDFNSVRGVKAAKMIEKMPREAEAHPAALQLIRKMSSAK